MPFSKPDGAPSRSHLPGRFALALARANADAQTRLKAASFAAITQDAISGEDYVQQIIASDPDDWSKLLNHVFPASLANGSAALNGFRHYTIQDDTYVEYYYRLNVEAVARSGTFDEFTAYAKKLPGDLEWVAGARNDLTTVLGVPEADVKKETDQSGWSQALKESIAFYSGILQAQDGNWLDLHIALVPCILGYDKIAKYLRGQQDTVRNTLYDSLWIEANAAFNTATKYRTFINGAITPDEWEKNKQRWFDTFKEACQHEINFFNLGLEPQFPVYDVVAADGVTTGTGTYTIRSIRKGSDGYLIPDASGKFVTLGSSDKDAEWELTNGKEGFTVKNVVQKTYLSVSITNGTALSYDVTLIVTDQPTSWSLNPFTAYKPYDKNIEPPKDPELYTAYQWFVSGNLQFALDARSQADSKVVVTNNSQISDQVWEITAVKA